MEGVSTTVYKGLKNYWQRRGYQRINNGTGRRRTSRSELGSTRRRRSWRIKIKPKLKILKVASPKKFFLWLRDSYVKMMMSLAHSRVCTSYGGAIAGQGVYRVWKGST
ncbi:hypothetical protein Patl1_00930 [Pistacia atlantica]|uniref:Uncharacterized protein n=1 Tax=Pistacia atlantica TaxID=434234 RepID=A0ACC1C5P2_9ROSI|nr:hypothetical protein Patl1_00930 [Pistacia atlantica]